MSFIWPSMLWLLLIVPLLMLLYWWVLRRKKKAAVSYANLAIVRQAMGAGQKFRRHVPPLLFISAVALMLASVARPTAVVTLPFEHQTVILAIDVSLSMRADDVAPSRMEAAQAAAKAFVEDQPRGTRIGVVSFAGTASVVQPPTQTREDVIAAIDRFKLQRGTAVGSGILVSLSVIFPDAEFDLRASNPRQRDNGREGLRSRNGGGIAPRPKEQEGPDPVKPAVEPGSYNSAVIILLTDGQSTTGPDPIESARMAAERGVRVYTVGIGTPNGEIIAGEGWRMRVRLDEDALKGIAKETRGEYFYAGTATDLKKVYSNLNSRLVMERKETEVTALFAAGAALLAVISAMLSLLWFNRVL
ncbi:MAG: VWA domain-containing protein [Lautropia sp.]|nr:VWA domain-containing protein [Lautropia sp.]